MHDDSLLRRRIREAGIGRLATTLVQHKNAANLTIKQISGDTGLGVYDVRKLLRSKAFRDTLRVQVDTKIRFAAQLAMDAAVRIMQDEKIKPEVQLKAAQWVFERYSLLHEKVGDEPKEGEETSTHRVTVERVVRRRAAREALAKTDGDSQHEIVSVPTPVRPDLQEEQHADCEAAAELVERLADGEDLSVLAETLGPSEGGDGDDPDSGAAGAGADSEPSSLLRQEGSDRSAPLG